MRRESPYEFVELIFSGWIEGAKSPLGIYEISEMVLRDWVYTDQNGPL